MTDRKKYLPPHLRGGNTPPPVPYRTWVLSPKKGGDIHANDVHPDDVPLSGWDQKYASTHPLVPGFGRSVWPVTTLDLKQGETTIVQCLHQSWFDIAAITMSPLEKSDTIATATMAAVTTTADTTATATTDTTATATTDMTATATTDTTPTVTGATTTGIITGTAVSSRPIIVSIRKCDDWKRPCARARPPCRCFVDDLEHQATCDNDWLGCRSMWVQTCAPAPCEHHTYNTLMLTSNVACRLTFSSTKREELAVSTKVGEQHPIPTTPA